MYSFPGGFGHCNGLLAVHPAKTASHDAASPQEQESQHPPKKPAKHSESEAWDTVARLRRVVTLERSWLRLLADRLAQRLQLSIHKVLRRLLEDHDRPRASLVKHSPTGGQRDRISS